MFRWIVGSSLQFRVLVLGVALAIAVIGVLRLQKMPLDVFPEFAAPVVEVQTEALGLSAREVESLLTLNLEELLSGVPWLKSIRSKSVTGLSSIVLTFQPGTDVIRARQMVQERLTLAYTLPNVASPPVILQPLSATSRFMMVGLSGKDVDLTELSLTARWTIKPKLTGVPGVANVAIWGQRLRQMHVHIDSDRLRDARLLQDDIIATTGDALWVSPLTFLRGSAPGTGGWIDNRNQRMSVHHQMPINSPEEMAKIPIGAPHLLMTGRSMSLGDVSEVTYAHPALIGDAIVRGGNGLMLVIEKFPSANTIEVTRGVEQALAELKRGMPGVEIDTNVFRLASYIDDSISNLTWALLAGAVLVLAVLAGFLFNWRSAVISAVSIPISLLSAILVLELSGATLNTLILLGLVVALGVVIDDAVVDVERIMKRLADRKAEATIASVIYETVLETRSAAIYAALIIMLAVTPIFFMGGVAGAFFEPLALAYVLAVVASMVVALTVTPALSLVLATKMTGNVGRSPLADALRARYEAMLLPLIQSPRKMLIGAGIAIVAGIALWPLLGQSLLPALKERELLVNLSTPAGTSHAETYRITTRVSDELRTISGVRGVGGHVGRAVTGDQVVGINAGQLWVGIDQNADYEKTTAAIREVVDGYPGLERSIQTYLRDKVGEVLTGAGTPIVVRLYGPKPEVLRQTAEEVRRAIADVPGIVDLRVDGQIEELQVQVKVSLDRAGKHNIKPGDVRRNSATLFSGITVGYLFEEQRINDVVVWGAPETRHSLSNLYDLSVGRSDRNHVRLSDVADVTMSPAPTVIRHEGISPYVDVVANVSGRALSSVAGDVAERLAKVQFPLEHSPKLLGEYAERVSAQRHMLSIAVAVVIGIFLLLQACFGSWRLALIGAVAIPAAVAGGVLAAISTSGVVTLGSIVGFLAVVGIAARSSLLLINHLRHLERENNMPFGVDLVVQGARERLSPLLISTTAIIAALLPIIVMGGIAGLEIAQPTAIVIIGGLIASTLVTLFVLPALYLMFAAKAARHSDLGLAAA
ncbi:MAG: efflux RND transporter permease subunit [Burkholderiales bacterium]